MYKFLYAHIFFSSEATENAVPKERKPTQPAQPTDQVRQDAPPALPARPEHTKSRVYMTLLNIHYFDIMDCA